MGEVVYLSNWQSRRQPDDEQHLDIDLLTAVDVALRDLADISHHISIDAVREQAEACRLMLKQAFESALDGQ